MAGIGTEVVTMTTTSSQKRSLGAYGERVAARHLEQLGMVVLARNWRCDEGEIDLVLRDHDQLVVCEVKTRSGTDFGTPHEAVSEVKLDRMSRLAQRWVAECGLHPPGIRFDLVAVLASGRGPAQVEHVRGLL